MGDTNVSDATVIRSTFMCVYYLPATSEMCAALIAIKTTEFCL